MEIRKNTETSDDNLHVNREYKSDTFKLYFSQKKELIELYNALNDTAYTVDDEVTINTLENSIFLKIYNDVSFVLSNTVNMYEHQSTINPNMPLRDLFYINDIYKKETMRKDLYGYKRIMVPTPKFVVFYNGIDDAPEKQILKLSDSYGKPTDAPELELTVTVLNVNYGHNKALMDKCTALRDYATLIQRIRDNLHKGIAKEEAIVSAVDSCIEDHIMEEFLLREKAGVINMHILDFDEELHNQSLVEYGIEQGIEQGISLGTDNVLINMIKSGELDDEKMAQYAGCSIEYVDAVRRSIAQDSI
ncbi:MAG: hypothetical protein J5509_10455 [Lachnospiraceae bacterium]|nr:hypothetical protein [Lachnospiraceae bacterium]